MAVAPLDLGSSHALALCSLLGACRGLYSFDDPLDLGLAFGAPAVIFGGLFDLFGSFSAGVFFFG